MAHIANLMTAESEPSSPMSKTVTLPGSGTSQKQSSIIEKAFTGWRMQQNPPENQRKYQLFPKERQLPVMGATKNIEPEKTAEKGEKTSAANGLRIRINNSALGGRRRKISVPEPAPMTTVQEVSMDSPTIPGRPPLHERSASAPGNTLKHHHADPFTFLSDLIDDDEDFEDVLAPTPSTRPLSPRDLTPLVIPPSATQAPRLISKRSVTHLRSGSQPCETLRSLRFDESPMGRNLLTPSPSTTDLTTPRSASTLALSATTVPTPVSAPIMESHRASPKPWAEPRCITPSSGERSMTPLNDDPRAAVRGHRRGASESSTIMDRGRPRKRSEGRNTTANSKNDSKPPISAERKAFEELPKGWRPREVSEHINTQDLASLRKQAIMQVERFEVLRPEDVEALSKELRTLDERTEYLRRTYTSLRAGRRNLHARICQYLRSPRVAKFSHESMLKQEEALAELDSSIDDWVSKLDMAENRRTRVRQKLLEHVAAAALLPPADASMHTITTPPRSPTKHSFTPVLPSSGSPAPSPQRVVAQVPSTILEQPEVVAADRVTSPMSIRRSDAESIRVYVGNDIYLYSLLADVENEITKMGTGNPDAASKEAIESKRKELHRKLSHEILNGITETKLAMPKLDLASSMPLSPPAPTPPMKDEPQEEMLLLSNSVFKP